MILFIFAVAIYAAHLRALPVTASLQSVTGDVQIMLPGGSWQAGTVNMSLPSGTQIKTGAKSSATVKWSSSNTLKINPFTNFTIKDIDIDPRTKTVTSNLDLTTGKVKAKAEKLHNPSSEFSISTPTAVAGVRGTEFDMENTPENTTSVTTRTGSVEVMSQGQSVMAVPGTQVVVQPNQPPAPPVPVSNEEMNACEVDEDCMSHKCVDGQCEGEESAMQSGGCRVIEAACTTGKDCCSGNCADGVCAEKAADQTAAACIPNGSACKAGDECCSKNCGEGSVCVAPPAASGSETATGTVAVATSDDEESEDEEEEIECFAELSKPEDGGSYPLSKGTVAVSGTTIAGATCVVSGTSVTAGANGAFTSEFTLASAGDTTVSVICSNSDGTCKAEAKVAIEAVAPPKLEISNPTEGFMQCPWIPISGMTNPGTNVYINGSSIKGNPKATIGADGSFSLDGFYQQDCTKPIEFVANDQFGQTTRLIINSGATNNAAAMGVNIQNVDVLLVPSGVWVNGQTSVQAVATAKSSTPFSGALTVTFTDGNGTFLGSRTLMPIAGATAAREDGSSAARASGQTGSSTESNAYYAQARMTIFSGPANPLIVRARIGDISVSTPAENAIVLRGIVCTRTAMVPGDGIDNDCDGRIDEDPVDGLDNDGDGLIDEDSPAIGAKCDSRLSQAYCDAITEEQAAQIGMKCDNRIDDDRDGRVDEESPDGIDNDGDGLIDEDLKCVCDPTDPNADCDFDGLRNGLDCNANKWESAPVRRDSALCAVSCNAQALPDGDCDGDGLLNAQEMALGTDPYKKDSDGDNYTDLQEIQAGTDPRKAEDNPGTRTYQTVTPSAAVCVGGQIKTPEGNCICPSGTMWSETMQSCMVASFAQCGDDQYFDTAVGGCVSSCTGGQVADSSIGRCYCATGFLGTEGYCLPGCPTGMVGDPATRVCVCQPGLYYDMSVNGCFATCSGGQVIDPIMNQCVCPIGTSLNPTTKTCVANVSATICPTGTAGAGCDFAIASRDCDADGILNVDDANPCVNETGVVVTESGTFQRLCPEGTDAVGCDLMTNPDCDLDGAPNASDQCPCRVGTAATNYCPTVAVTCPTGQYLDQFYGTCHTTCPAPKIGDPANMRCVCGPGTALDINTGQCVSSCPVGMVVGTEGECVCGPNAPLMDQFTAACSANCSGGQVTTPEMPGMCVCPQGYGPDFALKQCVMMCPDGMVEGPNGCVCGPSAPYMDPFTYGCQISCTGGTVADDPEMPGMCMCPEGTYPDQAAGECMSICPDGMEYLGGNCVCGGSTPFMDPFTEGCVASCTGGAAADDPEMPGMCICPEGTYPDQAAGECMSICPDGMVYSDGNCVCGGDTPFMDPFVDGCSAECTGGTVEDPMMPGFCVCPQGTNPDFGLMECVSVFDPCEIYGDAGICETDANCFWDVSKSRCNFDGGICGSYDMSACMSNTEDCYWNPAEMVCLENSGKVYCGGHTYEECNMDPACQWNMDFCGEAQGEISCGEIINDVDCSNTMGCMWDIDQCVMDMGGSCSQYVNSGICDQTPGCSWDYDFGVCEDVIDECAAYADMPSCNGDMSCGWNAYAGTCYSLEGDCTDIHLNDMDCVADERCEWNSMSNTCVFKMSEVCSTYTDMGMCEMQQGCMWDGTYCVEDMGPDCSMIYNDVDCANTMGCMWDGTYCVMDMGGPECWNIFNESTCNATMDCMWDGTYCIEDIVNPECWNNTDESSCLGMMGCVWNGTSCVQDAGSTCPMMIDESSCNSTMGCMWDGDQCVMDMGGDSCSEFVNSDICNQTPGCNWDYGFSECVEVVDDCAAYTTSSSCYGDMSCGWNSYAGNCYSLEGDCTDIHINDMDCVADDRCEWNMMATTCVFKMSEVCQTYTDMNMCNMQQGCLWDEVEMICVEDLAPAECFNIFNQMDCDNTFGCMWDGMTTECVQDFGDVCSLYENSTDCNNDVNCYYDGVSGCEMLDNGGNCGFFSGDQSICELHSSYCQWNTYGDGYCEAFDPGPGCYNYPGELECDAAPGCFWFAGETACLEIIPGECWNYTSQMQCGKDMLCMWDVDQCVVTGAGSECWNQYDQTTCGGTSGCKWIGTGCVEDIGCASYASDEYCNYDELCEYNYSNSTCVEIGTAGCGIFGDIYTCDEDSICAWNYNVNQCQEESMVGCGIHNGSYNCNNDVGNCEWSFALNSCVEYGAAGCGVHEYDEECNLDSNCEYDFNNYICVELGMAGCGAYDSDADCNSDPSCQYSFWAYKCYEEGTVGCDAYGDESSCGSDFDCEWYVDRCDTVGLGCSYYNASAYSCNNDPDCQWNYQVGECVTEGTAGCAGWSDSQMCGMQTGVCEWNYVANYCVGIGEAGCGAFNDDSACNGSADPLCEWNYHIALCNDEGYAGCAAFNEGSSCEAEAGCNWYAGLNRCDDVSYACSYYNNYGSGPCQSDTDCEWNYQEGSCVEYGSSGCSAYGDGFQCDGAPGCKWLSFWTMCVDEAEYPCSYWDSDNMCNMNVDCSWNYGSSLCEDYVAPDCASIYDSYECDNTMDCHWNGYECIVDMGGYGCMDNYTETACAGGMGCYWDGYNCYMDTGICNDYYSETPCENNENCYWNGYSCTDDLGCQSYNVNDCYYNGCEWVDNLGQCFESGMGCEAFNEDEWNCGNQFDCYWDAGNQLCVAQCGVGYHWNGYMCDEDTGTCSDYSDLTECNVAPGCYWDGYGSDKCLTLLHGSQCEAYGFEYSCNQNPTFCEWYGSGYGGSCGPIAVDCASYEEYGGPDACNSSSLGCEWNFNNYSCVPEGMAGCGAFADDSSICEDQTGVCEWSFNDNLCVDYGTAGCAGYGWDESAECDNQPYCVWDTYYGVCNTQWNLLCGQYGEPTTCNMDFGCVWVTGDPGSCMEMTNDSYCSTFADDASCETHSNYCNWYSASNVCAEAYHQCHYYSSTDSATCNSDPDCEWYYGEEFCANQGEAGCFKYGPSDQVACDEDAMCAWNGYMCDQDQGAVCSQYYDSYTCDWEGCFWYGDHCGANPCMDQNDPYACNESPYCYWWYDYCESGEGSGEPCNALSQSYCDAYGGGGICNWHTGDMSYCEPAGMVVCNEIIVEYECNSNPNCIYGEGCLDFSPMMCGMFESDDTACAAHDCYWDSGLQTCMAEEPGLQCSGYVTMETCNADMECVYIESNCYALNAENNCAMFIDETECSIHGQYCSWYVGLGICGGKSEGCGIYGSNDTACGMDANCAWVVDQCVEDIGGPACGEHSTLEACNTDSACIWDDVNSECVTFGGVSSCNQLIDQVYCENHSVDCKWYAGLMTCDGNTYGCGYYEFATVEQCNMDVDCDYNHNTDMCVDYGTAGCGEFGDSNTNCNAQTGICEWNYSDNHCVPFDTAGCSKYGPMDESMCVGDPNCEWDTDHCIESVASGCETYGTGETCNVNAECVWTGSTCADLVSASQCSMFTIENDCGYHGTLCNWYSGLNLCGDIALGCGYYGYGESACNADPDCEYNHNLPGCVDTGTAGCGMFGSSSSICNAEATCIWTGSDCDSFTEALQCSVFTIQTDCETHSSLCGWYAGVSLCDDASIGCSYYGSNAPACGGDMNCTMADSTDCYMYASSQSACETNIECAFSFSGGSACDGTPAPCVNYMDESACSAVHGCSWATGCAGDPTYACSFYSEQATCSVDSGCSWTGGCAAETLLCIEQ